MKLPKESQVRKSSLAALFVIATLTLTRCASLPSIGNIGLTPEAASKDFAEVGVLATANNDPIAKQCAIDGGNLANAQVALVASVTTGASDGLFTAIERRRLAQETSIAELARKAKASCMPLFIGPDLPVVLVARALNWLMHAGGNY